MLQNDVVFLPEGEKDVDTLTSLNLTAACSPDGAGPGKWREHFTGWLRGKMVYIIQDNDEAGRAFAQEEAAAISEVAQSVKVLDLCEIWPELPEHGDVSDLIRHMEKDQNQAYVSLMKLANDAPEWKPGSFEGFEGNTDFRNRGSVGFVGFVSDSDFCEFCGPDLSKNPAFPVDSLPDVLRDYSKAEAESLQVSLDMPAVAALTAAAICAQKKFLANPKPGWVEPVNLYTAIIALPSERKSPVLSVVMEPIHAFVKEENERRRPAVEEGRLKKDILQRRIDSMIRTATSGKRANTDSPSTIEDIKDLRYKIERIVKNITNYLSLIADDTTVEALISKMSENGEKMALVSSEGGIFNTLAGLYSGGMTNMDIILKAFSGDFVQVDRKGRTPETMSHPALTILLMVQPSVLEEVMKNREFAGRGLNARFAYSIPVSRVGRRKYDTQVIPYHVKEAYRSLIYRLLSIPEAAEPRIISFSIEAQAELRALHYELEPRLIGDLEPMGDWAGKHLGRVVRIAALIHICIHAEKAAEVPLSGDTVRRARAIGDYFVEHARTAYQLAGLSDDQDTRDAKYILKRLDSTGATEISKRDLHRLCQDRGGLETAEDMEPGLGVLVKRGYIKIEKSSLCQNRQNRQNPQNPKKGGRPSWMIYVNPEYTRRKEQRNGK